MIKVSGGVLNVRLHPHPSGVYGRFIESLYRLRKPVKVRGDRHAMISLLNRSEEDDGIYTGFITTFIKIDTDEPWFDAGELKEASDNKVSEISIPEDLYPNSAVFSFLFDTNNHRIYVQTYSGGKTLTINSAGTFFSRLADDLGITAEFGDPKITVVQSKVGLESVFSLPVIKRVIITIQAPNADIFEDDFDEKVEEYLGNLNSKKMTVVFEAESGKSINPNQQLRRLGESALDHGSVKTEGRDLRGATQRSTEDFPKLLHDKFDPDRETEHQAFRRITGK
ncbi:DUF4747 family protein [Sphingomonas abietis]|uniref:DUF4747 family protein n=1 Tax=Sphingomonas abietis TaxID=3012344 RepID=A0ABY7NJ99_9SPHN|nr:DUF4747 family protein [Sphingomonas abietis]WBO21610.1 DUF4747 family protein [Sphingomonas abietis]